MKELTKVVHRLNILYQANSTVFPDCFPSKCQIQVRKQMKNNVSDQLELLYSPVTFALLLGNTSMHEHCIATILL